LKVLYHLAETSKKFNPEIFITKNNALTDSLRDTIIRDIIHIIDGKKVKDECRMMFRNVEKSFMFYVDELFQSSETVYQLIRMRLLNQLFSPEYRPMLYFYVLSVFLYSLGIIKHSFSLSKLTPEDYLKISHAVFYHNIVVFEKLDTILKVESELILEKYYEENTRSSKLAMRLGLAPEVIEIIDYANNYHLDKKEFIKNSDRSSEFASIIVASQIFNMRELGLFSRKFSINHIIDELYSLVMINEMKKDVIDALAKGLRQNKLFDLYCGLDDIK